MRVLLRLLSRLQDLVLSRTPQWRHEDSCPDHWSLFWFLVQEVTSGGGDLRQQGGDQKVPEGL